MQKFIISLKEKQSGLDVMPPYFVNSLDGLGNYSERVSSLGLIVTVDSMEEVDNFVELKLKLMKSNNIWKIVIGAISAALGYVLNAIGL